MLFVLLLLLPGLKTEEVTPSNLIVPTTAKYLQFEAVKFLKRPKPTKQGPILFPNDGPSPPPTPLIVTSRPLIESIRRSELNPNNSIQASSQINQVAFTPGHLRRNSNSIPNSYLQISTPGYEFQGVPYQVVPVNRLAGSKTVDDYEQGSSSRPLIYRGSSDYINTVFSGQKKPSLPSGASPDIEYRDTAPDYTTYYLNKHGDGNPNKYYTQQRSSLPPIYRTFSNHANAVLSQQNKLASSPQPRPVYEYQKPLSEYSNYNPNRGVVEQNNNEQNHGDNYAFSYTVKDHQTGDDFSHSQSSRGSATNGEYRVRLPDGRMQIVSYTADEGGYKADVRYDDDHNTNDDNSSSDKEKQRNDFSNRYLNNRYTEDNSKVTNNNGYANNYDTGNLYVDYLDKSREVDTTNYNNNNNLLLGNVYKDNNRNNIYHNDNTYNNNGYSSEVYNEQTVEPKLDDYDHYSNEASTEHRDYSSENLNFQPYKSKYSAYITNDGVKSTVVPPYEEAKNLFVTQNPQFALVSTREPDSMDENVVIIGTKKPGLFTNVRNVLTARSVSPTPLSYTTAAPSVSTPSNYLYSTIANLKNKLNLSVKPILSQAYINKINKYLDFKF